MAHRPLNPFLYARLQHAFGHVEIANAGVAMAASFLTQMRGRFRIVTDEWGEFYRVNCPHCHDTRKRLYVHHRYGIEDDVGRVGKFLAICYNESCLEDEDNRAALWERLTDAIDPRRLRQPRLLVGKPYEPPSECSLPGPCVKLSSLPDDHAALTYLRERNFDPLLLEKQYGVCFCEDSRYRFARQRIIFPVWFRGKLMGWQARYVGELPWKVRPKIPGLPLKYFSDPDMKRNQLLYNFDVASKWRTGVVVEGPTDAISFGGPAMGSFGAFLSETQRRLLLATFRKPDRSLVLLWDPDVLKRPKDAVRVKEKIAAMKQAMPGQFAALWLPDGIDPGSTERDVLRRFVVDEAAKQGVEVRYERIANVQDGQPIARPRRKRLADRIPPAS